MKICVYGSSSDLIDREYIERTEELGRKMAMRKIGLVFGGGACGLMGAAARGVYSGKGEITGVAPTFFQVDGVLFEKCSEFIYTETMRERKQIMEDKSDAFIMTPGGIGTYEEFFEMFTLKQLGRHNKPIAIFNIKGYYDEMLAMLEKTVRGNFMREESLNLYKAFTDIDEMLDYIENYNEEAKSIDELKIIKR